MKNLFTYSLSFLSVIFLLISCDPCKDVNCQNDGVCDEGTCTCPSGYEGTLCEVAIRDKMIGTYYGSTECTDEYDNDTFNVVISTYQPDAGMVSISIDGRSEFQCDITSTNTFRLEGPLLLTDKYIKYEGTVNGDDLTVVSTVMDFDFNVQAVCTFNGKRQ